MSSLFELTGFQRDLLYVISGGTKQSGQDIKEELDEELGEVTRGRLYPNLDTLVESGHVEKGQLDRRTNYYELSDYGREQLRERRRWEDQYVDFEE